MKTLSALILLLLFATLAQAETVRYVSDALEVPLRRGASTRHKIIRMLPSGTVVEILQIDKANGYSLVRTQEGPQGWILSRYLMDTPSAHERLIEAQRILEPLKVENAKLKEQLNTLGTQESNTAINYQQLQEKNRTSQSGTGADSENCCQCHHHRRTKQRSARAGSWIGARAAVTATGKPISWPTIAIRTGSWRALGSCCLA